jgi:hypothetical protein
MLVVLLTSCGANFYLKHAKKDIAKAIAKGAKVDSLTETRWDSVKVLAFHDKKTSTRLVDELKVGKLCVEMVQSNLTKSVNTKIVNDLAKTICPKVKIDSTYNIELSGPDGSKYILPITVEISSSGSDFKYSIIGGTLRVPVKVETIKVGVKTGHTFWFDMLLAIGFFAIGFAASWIRGKSSSLKQVVVNLIKPSPPPKNGSSL